MIELMKAAKALLAGCDRAKTIEQVPDTDYLERAITATVAEYRRRRSNGRNFVPDTTPDHCTCADCVARKEYYGYTPDGKDALEGM